MSFECEIAPHTLNDVSIRHTISLATHPVVTQPRQSIQFDGTLLNRHQYHHESARKKERDPANGGRREIIGHHRELAAVRSAK